MAQKQDIRTQLINEDAMGAVSVSYPVALMNTGVSTLIGLCPVSRHWEKRPEYR